MKISALIVAFAFSLSGCSKGDGRGEMPPAEPTEASTQAPGKNDAPAAPTGPVGGIKGQVTLVGTPPEMKPLKRGSDSFCAQTEMKQETVLVGPNGGLNNVLVRVAPNSVKGQKPSGNVVVTQEDCMYRPRVVGAMVGQSLELRNSDQTFHNIHGRELALGARQGVDTIFNRAQIAKAPSLTLPLPSVDVLELKCDVHGWMKGYVVVSDHPYFTVTDENGGFEMSGVPVGEHTIEAWHELYGVKTGTLKVEEGGTAELTIAYEIADTEASP